MSNIILITGAKGQLGSEIKELSIKFANYSCFFSDKEKLNILDIKKVDAFVKEKSINVIINCAAYTNVDLAEDEFEIADLINNKAVASLAEVAKNYNAKLIHISTDYVFDGSAVIPYREENQTNPINIYGKTKLNGELAINQINPKNSIIIRTSWLYSKFGNNFVKKMLELSLKRDTLNIVNDQIGSPTNATDLAKVILKIVPQINNMEVETYHYSNGGFCSWFNFAKAIFEINNINCKVAGVNSKQYRAKALRPSYSVLNTEKIKNSFNLTIPHWNNSLKKCLNKM